MKTFVSLTLVLSLFASCSPSSDSNPLPAPIIEPTPADPVTPQKPEAWLEPGESTLIGQGQTINLFVATQKSADPFPIYIEATQVTWGSAQPHIASISSAGVVTGVSEGTASISASYQSYQLKLSVVVAGQMTKKNIAIPGQGTRTYYLYRPSAMPNGNQPLLISMHGGGGNGLMQASVSLINKVANEKKFNVIFPEGSGVVRTFNGGSCCGTAQTQNVNDVDFISKILDEAQTLYSIDPNKIYSTGFSNGGIMSHRLACQLAHRISGIAAVGGGSGQYDFDLNQYYSCNPTRPIPILHIHATNDRNFPIDGGTGGGVSSTNYYPVQSTINDWISRNNLTSVYSEEKVSISTTCYHYKTIKDSKKPSAKVTLCKSRPMDIYDSVNEIVYGGGHSWPGGVRSISEKSDIPLQDFKASEYLWTFLNP